MSELLRVGTQNEIGTATPMRSDLDGVLSVADSGRYIPHRGFNYTENLKEKKRSLKDKYIEREEVLIGNTETSVNSWSATADRGTKSADAYIKDNGDCSMKISTSSSSQNHIVYKSVNMDLSDFNSLHFWVHCDNLEDVDYFNITFQCPDNNNAYWVKTNNDVSLVKEMSKIFGKGEIAVSKEELVVLNGSPNLANCKAINISLKAKSGKTATVNIANMKMIKRKPKNAKIILRFDDGLYSVYEKAMPIFREYNIMGTCFINPYYVDMSDGHKTHVAYHADLPAMNINELHELHDMGWSICSHTWMHNLYEDTEGGHKFKRRHYYQAYKDLASVQDWLVTNGFGDGATSHVYGNHYYNEEVLKASTDLMLVDYSVHRNLTYNTTLPWAESVQHIGAESFVYNSNGKYFLIDEIIERGGLLVPMFHRIDGDGVDGSVSETTLRNCIEYILDKDGVDIITASDLAYATPVALR